MWADGECCEKTADVNGGGDRGTTRGEISTGTTKGGEGTRGDVEEARRLSRIRTYFFYTFPIYGFL